jgi:hypothetical protein
LFFCSLSVCHDIGEVSELEESSFLVVFVHSRDAILTDLEIGASMHGSVVGIDDGQFRHVAAYRSGA